jgi:hypothetical protein
MLVRKSRKQSRRLLPIYGTVTPGDRPVPSRFVAGSPPPPFTGRVSHAWFHADEPAAATFVLRQSRLAASPPPLPAIIPGSWRRREFPPIHLAESLDLPVVVSRFVAGTPPPPFMGSRVHRFIPRYRIPDEESTPHARMAKPRVSLVRREIN